MNKQHTCFFKWYGTRRNKNSKSILITHNKPNISPLDAKDLVERAKSKLLYRRKRWLTWFCSTSEKRGGGRNQLCRIEWKTLLPSDTYSHHTRWSSTPSKYDAKGEVNHFTQNTHGTEKQQVIGKIHLCPVQNMERNLNTLLSQMWLRQISNIKQRNVLRTFFRVKTEIVQARQSTLFVQYKRLCDNMTQRKGLIPFL